jgi:hypothetical protein
MPVIIIAFIVLTSPNQMRGLRVCIKGHHPVRGGSPIVEDSITERRLLRQAALEFYECVS